MGGGMLESYGLSENGFSVNAQKFQYNAKIIVFNAYVHLNSGIFKQNEPPPVTRVPTFTAIQ